MIYSVTGDGAQLLEASEFGAGSMDGNEDKLSARLALLQGCVAVYSQAVGASAIRQLKAMGVQAIKVEPGVAIGELLQLQRDLCQGPTGWLALALESRPSVDASRFESMAQEGWQEEWS